ncbi:MAG: hypothetical protein RLZZ437_1253 [Pseudomonadota bacterium]|jgi:hypothetical protein
MVNAGMSFETCPWDETAETSFAQSTAYAVAARAMGAQVGRMVLDGVQVQWLDRGALRMIARAGLGRGHLRYLARRLGATVAVPEAGLAGFGLVPLVTPQHVALWDIRAEPDVLLRGMAGKWRNRLVSADVRVRQGKGDCLEGLLAAEGVQRQGRGYRALPAGFTQALPGSALRLWEWRQGGQMGAAMCFVRHGRMATYHMGWAGAAARAAGVHGVMLWQAALALRAEGVERLDLGLVDNEAAPGLARFKLGTGAACRALGATVWVLPG